MTDVTADTDRRILLIAADNTFAHLYGDIAAVLAEPEQGDRFGGAVEFFHTDGQRLAPFFGTDWRMADLQPSAEPADPDELCRRLEAVFDHLERYLKDHPELTDRFRTTAEKLLADVPRSGGTLQEAIHALPWHMHGNSGNFLHNAMHAAGWAH
ncbi:hypothetical protein OG792_09175 [Micromonospora sp. NBC_01699]|uniref:hypothetical protein n=1 Tax=Micromonospora sp. NBC_01699 TaxID=2975984 RepID=UPI002E338A42|nr:hypothetical protein [Micromonospora sp. NBC_01699]